MHETGHNTAYGPRYRSGLSSQDGSSKPASTHGKSKAEIDRASFSSPQNRRASTRALRDSRSNSDHSKDPSRAVSRLQSRSSSICNVQIDIGRSIIGGSGHGGQGGNAKENDEGILAANVSLPQFRGAGASEIGRFDASSILGAGLRDIRIGSHDSTTSSSMIRRKSRTDQKQRSERVQEVLGSLPMLLVDDSVSILKLTKKAIQNECGHIRSYFSYLHDLTYTPLSYLSFLFILLCYQHCRSQKW